MRSVHGVVWATPRALANVAIIRQLWLTRPAHDRNFRKIRAY